MRSFTSPRDQKTLSNPSRERGAEAYDLPAESLAWPELDTIVSLSGIGVRFEDAWEMPPTLSDRLLAVARARRIDPRRREGGAVMGSKQGLKALLA